MNPLPALFLPVPLIIRAFGASPADYFIEIAFGFESSSKSLRSLQVPFQEAKVQEALPLAEPLQAQRRGPLKTTEALRGIDIEHLLSRFPTVRLGHLRKALAAARGSTGRAYALLLTPSVNVRKHAKYCALIEQSQRSARADKDRVQTYILSGGDWSPAAVSNDLLPDEVFDEVLEEVKQRWETQRRVYYSIVPITTASVDWTHFEDWTDEMLQEASQTYSSDGSDSTRQSLRRVKPTDLGYLWRQWYRSSLQHTDYIMAGLKARQSEERRRAKAVLFVSKVISLRASKQRSEVQKAPAFRSFHRSFLHGTPPVSPLAAMRATALTRSATLQPRSANAKRDSPSGMWTRPCNTPPSSRNVGSRAESDRARLSRTASEPVHCDITPPARPSAMSEDEVELTPCTPSESGVPIGMTPQGRTPGMTTPERPRPQLDDGPRTPMPVLYTPRPSGAPILDFSSPRRMTTTPSSRTVGDENGLPYDPGVSLEEFSEWFIKGKGAFGAPLGSMVHHSLAKKVWQIAHLAAVEHAKKSTFHWAMKKFRSDSAQVGTPRTPADIDHCHPKDYDLYPTWTQLRAVISSWHVPQKDTAGWLATFSVCFRRYCKKLLRKRRSVYALVIVTFALGAFCGSLHGNEPRTPDLFLFYILFNAMFGSVVASSTIASLGGGGEESLAFFLHEASSGISQSAEGLARLLVDLVWPLLLLPLAFAFSSKALCSIPLSMQEYLLHWWLVTYALSPVGYFFHLITPGNAIVLTSSVTLIFCAFTTGFFGLRVLMLTPTLANALIWLSPGPAIFFRLTWGAIVTMPFGAEREYLTQKLTESGLFAAIMGTSRQTSEGEVLLLGVPANEEKGHMLDLELGRVGWGWRSAAVLLTFGTVFRAIVLLLFVLRNNLSSSRLTNKFKAWRTRVSLAKQRRESGTLRGRMAIRRTPRERATLLFQRLSTMPIELIELTPGPRRPRRVVEKVYNTGSAASVTVSSALVAITSTTADDGVATTCTL